MNTECELRTKAKNDSEDFFKLINNSVFGKTMKNVGKYRGIKLITTDKRKYQLVSQTKYNKTKWFSKHLLAIEMKKTEVKMNKPIYLGLSVLDISKLALYEYWYDYVKPKYGDKAKMHYMDTDSFIVHAKSEHIYADL